MKCELKLLKKCTVEGYRKFSWKGWLGVVGAVIVAYLLSCMHIEVYLALITLELSLLGLAYYGAHQKCREPKK